MSERPKIAAVVTTYYPASHADVIVGKFVRGFPTDDGLVPPLVDVVSLYMDQVSDKDVGVALAEEHGIRLCHSIPEALGLGGKDLAVDGVLSIGEHGDYAFNEKGQHLYPRRHFLKQICGAMASSHRVVPLFSDKYLAHCWEHAHWMYERTRALGVPFMAGSSVPLFWRNPWLEHPVGTPLDEALVVSYGGLEAYGYHGLEAMQIHIERRAGGESGVAAVQCLEGDAVWRAADDGRWSRELGQAAAERATRDPSRTPGEAERAGESLEELCGEPALFLIEFRDGFRAALLHAGGRGSRIRGWSYAARTGGQVMACGLESCGPPYPHFSYMGLNIQQMFLTGQAQYPVERTLLVTGVLDALMDSRHRGHVRVETPHLDVAYPPPAHDPIRPRGPRPKGASTVPFED